MSLEDFGLNAEDFEVEPGQWGGNRTFDFLKRKLAESTFTVKDAKDGKVYEGPSGLKMVCRLLDWKLTSNASDLSADMIIQIITKLCIPFQHSIPKSWYLITKLANPTPNWKLKHSRCVCQ